MALVRTDDGITSVSRDPRLRDLQRDPLPPVSHLPAEILADIFIHNARSSYVHETYIHSELEPAMPTWINVSYVCRHWRDIAINCQIFWSYIPTTSQRWTQELLARSQRSPLQICIVLNFRTKCTDRLVSRVLSIAEQLMNHSQRIQGLYLDFNVTEEYHYEIQSKFFSSRLPRLQHLEISKLGLLDEESPLPLEGKTPALRTLILKDCCMQWNSLELSGLTTLDLDSVKLPFPQIITMAEFLAMLRHMPNLIQLSILDSLPTPHDALSSGELNAAPMINLPHLSNMSIRAPISTVNTLLSCADIPLTTKVELGCPSSFESTHDDITRLVSLLAQRRINPSYDPELAVPKFRSPTIDSDNSLTAIFTFRRWTRGCSFSFSLFSGGLDKYKDTRLLVCFWDDQPRISGESARIKAIVNHMCRFIPLTSIQSIHFDGHYPYFWMNTLACLPNVRHIKLSGGLHAPDIASILSLLTHNCSGDKDSSVGGDQKKIFVPSLEELELREIIFERVDSLRSDIDTLCEAISAHKETQCRLVIKRCYVSPEYRQAVELIGWWENAQFKVAPSHSNISRPQFFFT